MIEPQQVNLVAVVGAGGAIGPADALPQMMYEDEAAGFEQWFLDLTEGGIIVLGGRSFRWLVERGLDLGPTHQVCVWTRENSHAPHTGKTGHLTPDDFLQGLYTQEKPIFVCGGLTTYEVFMPYVRQFFIRRVALKAPHDNYMPPLFGRSQ